MNVDQFVNAHKPSGKRHPLLAYQNEIEKLHGKGYSYGQIRQFLEHNGINVSAQSIARFVRRYIKKSPPSQVPTMPSVTDMQPLVFAQQNQTTEPKAPVAEPSVLDTALNSMNFEQFL